jgi:tRNA pseudouridine38-40 synthase
MNPLLRTQAWHVPKPLDVAGMRAAARQFLGTRDFKSLAANRNYEMESTVRTLSRCDVKRSGSLITLVIEGDGFLYKMCRGIAGTLVQLGLGKIGAQAIPEILEGRDRRLAGMTAPAHGLVLWKVYFGGKVRRPAP